MIYDIFMHTWLFVVKMYLLNPSHATQKFVKVDFLISICLTVD
jgi:hypothetical protein